MDIVSLDQRALAAAGQAVAMVRPGQLEQPTPCGDWTLRDLLGHMIAHNHGFAAAARGGPVPATVWDAPMTGDDPVPGYAESEAAASAAFAAPGALEGRVELPGLGVFPARTAISFHFVDYLVHAWDVAAATGMAGNGPDEELVKVALSFATRWPDTPATRGPGAAFGPRVPVPCDAAPFDQLLGLLGRSPSWPS